MGALNKTNNINNKVPYELFNELQIAEIKAGKKAGVDITIYAKPEFNDRQMHEIRQGLMQGIDVSWFADPEYCWEQMHMIRTKILNDDFNDK